MPFPKQVKMDALVAAARHCCVCNRYKGVKVEVHHIVPSEQGGTDTADNAIALCFDCHADAGHYNPKHPRGTKFSPEELRLARDTWHMRVRINQIDSPDHADSLYCRYLVCKSFSAIAEIVGGDLSNFPATAPLLAPTEPRDFIASLVHIHPKRYRHSFERGRAYASRAEYSSEFPDVRLREPSTSSLYPYFEAARVPGVGEVVANVAPHDGVTAALLDADVPVDEICEALAYEEFCGNGGFQEIYRTRPLWLACLAVTNFSDSLVQLSALECEAESPQGPGYRTLSERVGASAQIVDLPKAPLPPNATAVFPVATMLGPFVDAEADTLHSRSNQIPSGEMQETAHVVTSRLDREISLIGPALWPSAVQLRTGSETLKQEFHQLAPGNLYVISRYWEAGCCPHIFFDTDKHGLVYAGEVWARWPHTVQHHSVTVPPRVCAIVLVELENEIALLQRAVVNGSCVETNRCLERGESLRIGVRPGDSVELIGSYVPDHGAARLPDPWWKNSLVRSFLAAARQQRTGADERRASRGAPPRRRFAAEAP